MATWTKEQDRAFQEADRELVRLLSGVADRAEELIDRLPTRYANEHGEAFSPAWGWLLDILLTWITENTEGPAADGAVRVGVQDMYDTLSRHDYTPPLAEVLTLWQSSAEERQLETAGYVEWRKQHEQDTVIAATCCYCDGALLVNADGSTRAPELRK